MPFMYVQASYILTIQINSPIRFVGFKDRPGICGFGEQYYLWPLGGGGERQLKVSSEHRLGEYYYILRFSS